MRKLFLLLAVISLVVGFLGESNPFVSGAGKAGFGVFFILFYISRLLDGVDDNAKA